MKNSVFVLSLATRAAQQLEREAQRTAQAKVHRLQAAQFLRQAVDANGGLHQETIELLRLVGITPSQSAELLAEPSVSEK